LEILASGNLKLKENREGYQFAKRAKRRHKQYNIIYISIN